MTQALRARLRPLVGPDSLNDRPQGAARTRVVVSRLLERYEPAYESPAFAEDWIGLCIYRARNAARVARLLQQHPAADWRLWALDEPAGELARQTIGHGPGLRFTLLNRLAHNAAGRWIAVVDDDVEFTRGSLGDALAITARAQLDLSGPAHDHRSFLSWELTRRRIGSVARRTRFVEQGPVVLFGPRASRRLLPLPEDMGMGWGIEALWAHADGLELGIIDAVAVRHLHAVSPDGYDVAAEWQRSLETLQRYGLTSWKDLHQCAETWHRSSSKAPWTLRRGDPRTRASSP